MIYYTNLSPEGFRSLFDSMAPELKVSWSHLTPEEELLMVLAKLTLDLDDKDVAFRFGVEVADVALYLDKWIPHLAPSTD